MKTDIWDLIDHYYQRFQTEDVLTKKEELRYYVDQLVMAFINECVAPF